MSGYLNRSKGSKKQWKRLWFVIKNKVLYTYAASEVLGLDPLLLSDFCAASLLRCNFGCVSVGCSSVGEPASAGILPEGGEERAGSEAAVQAVPQKHSVLHL